MVSANPNATVVAIAERATEQILSRVDDSLRRGRSDIRVSRHGPIPAPPDGRPADAMAIVGWVVSRSRSGRARAAVASIAVAIVACVAATVAGPSQLAQEAVVVAVVLILAGCGAGSVVGWAVRMMLSHLATVGALAVRALPVVLLTALVFFNGYVWLMAATISGDRLGLAMAFLVSIAAAFVVSATRERVPLDIPRPTDR